MKPEPIAIDQRDLDYLPEVAQRIAIKLSFGFDDVATWNVFGAPTAQQQLDFLALFLSENELHPRQLENLEKWMSVVIAENVEVADEESL